MDQRSEIINEVVSVVGPTALVPPAECVQANHGGIDNPGLEASLPIKESDVPDDNASLALIPVRAAPVGGAELVHRQGEQRVVAVELNGEPEALRHCIPCGEKVGNLLTSA
jgi:hypothetical protein